MKLGNPTGGDAMHHATPKALIACLLALPLAACGDEGGDQGASSGFCDEANQMTDEYGASMPVSDEREIDVEWLAVFEAIEPAPDIADEWAILIRDYKAYNEAVEDVDWDALEQQMSEVDPTSGEMPEEFADVMSKANEAMAITQTEEHVTASNTVSQYLTEECSTEAAN